METRHHLGALLISTLLSCEMHNNKIENSSFDQEYQSRINSSPYHQANLPMETALCYYVPVDVTEPGDYIFFVDSSNIIQYAAVLDSIEMGDTLVTFKQNPTTTCRMKLGLFRDFYKANFTEIAVRDKSK